MLILDIEYQTVDKPPSDDGFLISKEGMDR